VRSMLRIKELHDRVETQAAELASWNRTLEQRVVEQLAQIERVTRLKRFLSPQIAELILSSSPHDALASHRRQVTIVFCDLRGFTAFAEIAEPEDVMAVMREYHATLGSLIHEFEGTLERFLGDGIMVIFGDPIPCPDPCARAVQMAVVMRGRLSELSSKWRRERHELGFGVGIAYGYATLGAIGFEGRSEYSAIGTVVNLAARLCAEARDGQILIDDKVRAALDGRATAEPVGELTLKGLHRPIEAFNVLEIT
jgi:adenylate cyclase